MGGDSRLPPAAAAAILLVFHRTNGVGSEDEAVVRVKIAKRELTKMEADEVLKLSRGDA